MLNNNNNIDINNDNNNTDINNRNEILFFKVFRNKFLFHSIFKNFIYKELYNYDRLINTLEIFYYFDNYIEIIKDKVKSNSFILLNPCNLDYGFQDLLRRFNRRTPENIEFFQQLFKNYNKYFQYPKVILPILLFECDSSSSFALDQYIKYFNISKITIKGILYCIKEFTFDGYKSYKIYNYLKKNQLLSNLMNLKLNIKTIYIFYNGFRLKDLFKICKIISKYNLYGDESTSTSTTTTTTTTRDKYIIGLNEIESFEKMFTKEQLYTENILLVLKSLNNDIGYGHYVEDEYLSKEILNSHNHQLKNSIYKLIQFFYSFSDDVHNKPMQYIFMFCDYKTIRDYELKELIDFSFNSISNYFQRCNSITQQIEFINDQLNLNHLNHFGNSKEENISCNNTILEMIVYIISTNSYHLYDHIFNKGPISTYLKLCINDVIQAIKSKESLDYFYKFNQDIIYKDNNTFWNCFSTLELLEYYEKKMMSIGRSLLIDSFQIQEYDRNYPRWYDDKLNPITMNLFLRAINQIASSQQTSTTIYKLSDSFLFESYSIFYNSIHFYNSIKNEQQGIFISIIESPLKNFENIFFNMIFPRSISGFFIIAKYLFSNIDKSSSSPPPFTELNQNEIIQIKINNTKNYKNGNKIITIHLTIKQYWELKFSAGHYSDLFSNNTSPYDNILLYNIVTQEYGADEGRIEFVDQFITYFKNKNKSYLFDFISNQIIKGHVQTFNLILSKYPNILKVKSNNTSINNDIDDIDNDDIDDNNDNNDDNDGIFSKTQLKQLLIKSIESNNVEIIEILINNCNIKISENEIKSLEIIKNFFLNYFKGKFN